MYILWLACQASMTWKYEVWPVKNRVAYKKTYFSPELLFFEMKSFISADCMSIYLVRISFRADKFSDLISRTPKINIFPNFCSSFQWYPKYRSLHFRGRSFLTLYQLQSRTNYIGIFSLKNEKSHITPLQNVLYFCQFWC